CRDDLFALDAAGQRSAVFDGQRIAGDVVGPEPDGLFERVVPRSQVLPGQSVDEVQVDTFEAGGARQPHSRPNRFGGMNAVEEPQLLGVEALCAEGDAGDARAMKRRQPARVGGPGVGFEADLGALRDGGRLADGSDDRRDVAGGHFAGGATAERDCAHSVATKGGSAGPKLGNDRVTVALVERFEPSVGVEVAVATLDRAERDVDIDREWARDGLHVVAGAGIFSAVRTSATRSVVMPSTPQL